MKQVSWNLPIYLEFQRLAFLSDFQTKVMDRHVRGCSDTQIAIELNCSQSTVERAIRQCKKKYDEVQPYSPLLPKRKKVKEK